jgi:hypothetical protein
MYTFFRGKKQNGEKIQYGGHRNDEFHTQTCCGHLGLQERFFITRVGKFQKIKIFDMRVQKPLNVQNGTYCSLRLLTRVFQVFMESNIRIPDF